MSIIATDIVTDFGAYYINEGQNEQRLMSAIRQKAVTTTHATPIIHDSDVYRSANTDVGEIVQAFQKAFTPKGDLTFTPNEIILRNLKIDLALYPDDVKGKWLGFLASLDDQERKNWPIVRYLVEKHVVSRIPHDMETKAYYKGVYAAATPGTATATVDVMDGLGKIITTGLTGNMNTVALTDAITESNAFDRVEEFVDGIDDILDEEKIKVYMDKKILKWYLRDKRNTHGTDVNYDAGKITIDFTENCQLIGLPSMKGEKRIWATTEGNFVYIRKQNGMKKPKVEEAKREVFLMLDWWEAVGFEYDELVFAADWI